MFRGLELLYKSILVRVLLTFNASARACGQKRCQSMWNLRTYKAICDNIQPSGHWSLDHEVKIRRLKKHCSIFVKSCVNIVCIYLVGFFPVALPVSELSRRPTYIFLPSHFRDSWKDSVAQHLNTSPPTALKSHKSRTPLVHHLIPFFSTISKPGATDPPSQAPGLGSFLANLIVWQVDSRKSLVDF